MDKTDYSNSAKYYDNIMKELYSKKPETLFNFVNFCFKKHSNQKVIKILELGCGTGIDTIYFREKGFEITGLDISKDMLSIAKQKATEKKLKIEFVENSMTDFNYNSYFDSVITFGAFGHLLKNTDIEKTLHNVYSSLKKNGLFILYQENALSAINVPVRKKIFQNNGLEFQINITFNFNHLTLIGTEIQHIIVKKDNKIIDAFDEPHIFRFWTFNEGKLWLEKTGFSDIHCYTSLQDTIEMQENNYSLIFCCKK